MAGVERGESGSGGGGQLVDGGLRDVGVGNDALGRRAVVRR